MGLTVSRQWSQTTAYPGDTIQVAYNLTLFNNLNVPTDVRITTLDDNLSAYLSASALSSFTPWTPVNLVPGVSSNVLRFNTVGMADQDLAGNQTLMKQLVFDVTIGSVPPQIVPGVNTTKQNVVISVLPQDLTFEDANNLEILAPICVAENTRIELANGIQCRIQDLCSNSLVQSIRGPVPVLGIAQSGSTTKFIKIKSGKHSLLITDGHPLLLNNREVLPESLLGNSHLAERVEADRYKLFTLITPVSTFVNMNGIMVKTWGQETWRQHCEQNGIAL